MSSAEAPDRSGRALRSTGDQRLRFNCWVAKVVGGRGRRLKPLSPLQQYRSALRLARQTPSGFCTPAAVRARLVVPSLFCTISLLDIPECTAYVQRQIRRAEECSVERHCASEGASTSPTSPNLWITLRAKSLECGNCCLEDKRLFGE